jgi:hypothetical protein
MRLTNPSAVAAQLLGVNSEIEALNVLEEHHDRPCAKSSKRKVLALAWAYDADEYRTFTVSCQKVVLTG